MFYSFYGTYTKIFMIFESAHNLIHKFKHKAKTAQKEKEKDTVQRAAWKLARRPAHARSARTRLHSLAGSLTGGTRPSDASPTSRHGSGELQLPAGELPASAVRHVSFPSLPRTRRYPLHPLSPILAPVTTGTADGRLGRANAGHDERVEREPTSA